MDVDYHAVFCLCWVTNLTKNRTISKFYSYFSQHCYQVWAFTIIDAFIKMVDILYKYNSTII